MDANQTSEILLNLIRRSNLNFNIIEFPFSLTVTVKKSFIKNKNGSLRTSGFENSSPVNLMKDQDIPNHVSMKQSFINLDRDAGADCKLSKQQDAFQTKPRNFHKKTSPTKPSQSFNNPRPKQQQSEPFPHPHLDIQRHCTNQSQNHLYTNVPQPFTRSISTSLMPLSFTQKHPLSTNLIQTETGKTKTVLQEQQSLINASNFPAVNASPFQQQYSPLQARTTLQWPLPLVSPQPLNSPSRSTTEAFPFEVYPAVFSDESDTDASEKRETPHEFKKRLELKLRKDREKKKK
jgi:hypothetical protein